MRNRHTLTTIDVLADRRRGRCSCSWSPASSRRSAGSTEEATSRRSTTSGRSPRTTFNHWYRGRRHAAAAGPEEAEAAAQAWTASRTRPLKQQVMQFLISSDWIEGEAKERGISATPEEIQRQFKQTKKQSFPNEKAYQRFLATLAARPCRTCSSACARRALEQDPRGRHRRARTNVCDGAIKDYYDKNAQQFSQPERRDLEVDHDQEPGQGATRPSSGSQSGRAGRRSPRSSRSTPPRRTRAASCSRVTKGQQDPAFDAAIFSAVKGKIAGPVKTDAGYYVFRVTKVTPGTKQSLQPVHRGHHAAARLAEPAEEARPVLDRLPQRLAREDRLRARLRDPRLPQRP